MSDQPKTGTSKRRPGLIDLRLDTLENVADDLAEATKLYMAGEIADTPFRAFVYSCNSMTRLLHAAKLSEIEKRLRALEAPRER
jgi:hypothetical protein